ncbi:MAG: hypothetical protein WC438_00635 [Candidatus Pacearchaeota archaeon]
MANIDHFLKKARSLEEEAICASLNAENYDPKKGSLESTDIATELTKANYISLQALYHQNEAVIQQNYAIIELLQQMKGEK